MEFPLDRYYGFNRLLLSLSGLWPYRSALDIWICRVFILLMLTWAAVAQIIKIYMTELTLDFVFDVLPVLYLNIGVIFLIVIRIASANRTRDLLERIKADWERTESQDEIKIMHTHAAAARIITLMFSIYIFVMVHTYMFITILPQILDTFLSLNESRSREHPFKMDFIFINEEKYFYVIRFLMYVMCMIIMEPFLAHVTMFVVYIQHASGMFVILGHRAERVFNGDTFKVRSFRKNVKDYRSIVLFVEYHRDILEFVDTIQFTYNLTLILEFVSLMMLIGLTLLQVIKFSGVFDQSFRFITCWGALLIYLYVYSYMGQKLIDTSAQIPIKIYFTKWYIMPAWKRKIMLFVMMRCMRTVSISIFNICSMNLETLSMIMQSAISFCMVLRSI